MLSLVKSWYTTAMADVEARSVAVDDELWARVARVAEEREVSRSWVVRQSLRSWLAQAELVPWATFSGGSAASAPAVKNSGAALVVEEDPVSPEDDLAAENARIVAAQRARKLDPDCKHDWVRGSSGLTMCSKCKAVKPA